MSTLVFILVAVAVVAIGLFGFSYYMASKNARGKAILHIYKAFQDVQLVISHEKGIDMHDLADFVKSLAQKDALFGGDRELLNYIEDYYRRCNELNRKADRIRITQSRDDLEILLREKERAVEWFRGQDKIIRGHFSRYISL